MKISPVFIYRFCGTIAGIGWAICILATIVSGPQVFMFLNFVSENQFDYHPMLDYWMKMAAIAFTFVGLGFLYISKHWKEYLSVGKYFALLQIISGIGVLISIVRLDLSTNMYLLDCLFFFGTGLPMIWAWRKLSGTSTSSV